MNKLRTIIVDDEKLARELIRNFLEDNERIEILEECSNGFDATIKINELKPDLVFLDIQMPKINGFEMLELLDDNPNIIFTTAYDEYALKAFEVNAVDYLLKPFSKDRLLEAIAKVNVRANDTAETNSKVSDLINSYRQSQEALERIIVKDSSKISIIPISELFLIEAQNDYVMLFTNTGKFLKQKTMKFFEENLPKAEFVRIHRSYIVKLSSIKEIELFGKDSYRAKLKDGNAYPISKNGYAKLKELINQ